MPSLEDFGVRNNLQMQEWVKEKINSCESQIKLWTLRLNDRAYFQSKQYINCQIGKYTLDVHYFKYFQHLLEEDFKKIKKYKCDNYNQIKL